VSVTCAFLFVLADRSFFFPLHPPLFFLALVCRAAAVYFSFWVLSDRPDVSGGLQTGPGIDRCHLVGGVFLSRLPVVIWRVVQCRFLFPQ